MTHTLELLSELYTNEVGPSPTSVSKYLIIDGYSKSSKLASAEEVKGYIEGVEPVQGDKKVWDLEEYIIVEL